MRRLIIPVFLCVLSISCSGSLKSLQVSKEYKYKSFFDKKLLVAPFSRAQLIFADDRARSRFDSLDALCSGQLADSLSSSFISAVLGGLQTINGINAEWTQGQKAAFFREISDTSAMVKAVKTDGKKQLTFFVPGASAVHALAPEANMICYVQKTGARMSSNNYPVYFMDFVIYDLDSGRVVSGGSIAPQLTMFEAAKLSDRKTDDWVKRFTGFAPSLLKNSPFSLESFTKGRPAMFGATYSFAFLTGELKVNVDAGKYDTSLIKTADAKTRKFVYDTFIKPKIKELSSAIKEFSLKRLSGFSKKQEEERMKKARGLCGMVTYIGTVDGNRNAVVSRFSSSFKDQAFTEMIDGLFNAAASDAAAGGTETAARFVVPIVISVGPEESKGTYYRDPFFMNQFNQPKPPPIPRF